MLKIIRIVFLLSLSFSIYAEEFFVVPEKKLLINTDKAEEKIEELFNNPEPLLKRYQPADAKITEKKVSKNRISFKATKTVLFITNTVLVNGVLNVENNNLLCPKGQVGYLAKFDLLGSDALVYDNIDRLEAKVCLRELDEKNLELSVKAKIFKSANYTSTLGGIVKGLIEAQVNPLFLALTEEVKARK